RSSASAQARTAEITTAASTMRESTARARCDGARGPSSWTHASSSVGSGGFGRAGRRGRWAASPPGSDMSHTLAQGFRHWVTVPWRVGHSAVESVQPRPANPRSAGRALNGWSGSDGDTAGAGASGDDRLHIRGRVKAVAVRDGGDAAAALGRAGVDEDVVALHQRTWAGAGVTDEGRVIDVLEVVALDQDAGVHGRGDAVLIVEVVVVVHVHGVAEPDPGVAGAGSVEPVVVVGHPQVANVLTGVAVAVPEQHRLVVVEDSVPRHGDEVRAALDVHGAVIAVGEAVVVDPDIRRRLLHIDRVVIPVPEGQVPDDDISAAVDGEPAAGDCGAGVAQDGGVRSHADHARA